MTNREKLIEILSVPIYPRVDADPAEVVADYLLDNGVTIQKWIPVTERLPGENKGEPGYEDDFFLVSFTGVVLSHDCEGFMMTAQYCGNGIWETVFPPFADITEGVTHWMPLPEPPQRRNYD